jgi:hypothetical protein
MGRKSREKKDLSRQADIEVRKCNQLDRKGNFYRKVSKLDKNGNDVTELSNVLKVRKLQLNSQAKIEKGLEGFIKFISDIRENLALVVLNNLTDRKSINQDVGGN